MSSAPEPGYAALLEGRTILKVDEVIRPYQSWIILHLDDGTDVRVRAAVYDYGEEEHVELERVSGEAKPHFTLHAETARALGAALIAAADACDKADELAEEPAA